MAEHVKTCDLRLADVVKVFDGPWSTGIVTHIDGNMVTMFRPYGTTADFSYSGGVIPYIGTETIKVPVDSSRMFLVMERKELR